MRTITVSNKSMYFKYAEIEVSVPDDIEDVQEWLIENEDNFVGRIDEAISKADYNYGTGNWLGMSQPLSNSVWRYDVEEDGKHIDGGHL